MKISAQGRLFRSQASLCVIEPVWPCTCRMRSIGVPGFTSTQAWNSWATSATTYAFASGPAILPWLPVWKPVAFSCSGAHMASTLPSSTASNAASDVGKNVSSGSNSGYSWTIRAAACAPKVTAPPSAPNFNRPAIADEDTLGAMHDLRSHLTDLEARAKLVRVSRPINKDTELHPLVRWQFRGLPESERKAFLFERVIDARGREYSMPVVVGALAGSEEIYALSMGCTSDQVLDAWRRALAKPLPAIVVEDALVQEVVHQGDSLLDHEGLDELPVPISTPGFDNAPYFNSAIWITKDPETGVRNAGVYRGMLKSPLRTGVFCDSSNNTALN